MVEKAVEKWWRSPRAGNVGKKLLREWCECQNPSLRTYLNARLHPDFVSRPSQDLCSGLFAPQLNYEGIATDSDQFILFPI